MASKLLTLQWTFSRQVPLLISKAHELGYEVVGGDWFRDARVHGKLGIKLGYGNAFSCHKIALAIDLNLFKNGVYLTETEDHRPLGEWWEKQHVLNCWGGRFGDGNHYSMTYEGVK
jgi:hypothetical protein